VSVVLVIQHATRMRHIVICGLPRSTIFFHIISQTVRFSWKSYWTQNVCFDFLYNFRLKHFSFQEEFSEIWSKMYIGLHVKWRLLWSDFNETWVLQTDFRNILKYQILWKSVQWEPSCPMRTDRQTERHDGDDSRFSHFCLRAKNWLEHFTCE